MAPDRDDRDASGADVAEQEEPVVADEADDEAPPEIPADVPEADAIEQAQDVPDEDDRRD